jgi:hypothetical protein
VVCVFESTFERFAALHESAFGPSRHFAAL